MWKILLLLLAMLSPLASAQTPQYKGVLLLFSSVPADQTTFKAVLMLYAPGTTATDQPTQTMVWGQDFADPAQAQAIAYEKAKELNASTSAGKWLVTVLPLGAQTGQPIQTTIWPRLYADTTLCAKEVGAKAAELNQVYLTAGESSRWVSACVGVK